MAKTSPSPFPCRPRDRAALHTGSPATLSRHIHEKEQVSSRHSDAFDKANRQTTGNGSAVGLVVGSQDVSGDAAAVADLVTALARPLPDRAEVATTRTSGPCLARALAAAGATSMSHPRAEVVAQLLGVCCGQVDLV